MSDMNVKVDKKNKKLIIELPLRTPAPSKSGKTMIIASTNGNVASNAEYEGKVVTVGVNAWFKPE